MITSALTHTTKHITLFRRDQAERLRVQSFDAPVTSTERTPGCRTGAGCVHRTCSPVQLPTCSHEGGVWGLPVLGQTTLPTNLQPFEYRLSRRCWEPFENPTKNQWVNLHVAILAESPARDRLAIGDFQLMSRTLKYSDSRITVFCA